MDGLVKDILDLSRVNRDEYEPQEVNLNETLREVRKDLNKVLSDRKVHITASKMPTIMADRSQMFQLFLNLISNAVKYNESKEPDLVIKARRNGANYVISFADNGIGIAEEYREKVFEIFQRLHPREKYSGTGIGLTLCKRIVERHKGKIWVEKNGSKGSVFYVSLPA